jgi:hypothetical protein
MRAVPKATSLLVVPSIRRRGWFASVTHGRRRSKLEDLELIERLDRLEREARRSGAYVPKLGPQRPWL